MPISDRTDGDTTVSVEPVLLMLPTMLVLPFTPNVPPCRFSVLLEGTLRVPPVPIEVIALDVDCVKLPDVI